MKEDKGYEEFKKEAEVMMEKDLKKIIKISNNLPKVQYTVLKELVKISPMKEILRTVWTTAFHAGIRLSKKVYEKGKEKK